MNDRIEYNMIDIKDTIQILEKYVLQIHWLKNSNNYTRIYLIIKHEII